MEWFTENVAVAAFGALGVLFTATSGVLVAIVANASKHAKAAAADAAVIRHEVKNSHATNFREEQDARHEAQMLLLKSMADSVTGTQSDVRGIRRDNARTLDRLEAHILDDQKLAERIRRLEETRSTP